MAYQGCQTMVKKEITVGGKTSSRSRAGSRRELTGQNVVEYGLSTVFFAAFLHLLCGYCLVPNSAPFRRWANLFAGFAFLASLFSHLLTYF
jgi:hypothetical protein